MTNRISIIQMTSINDVQKNLETAKHYLQLAAKNGANIAVLPEMFATLSVESGHICAREPLGQGPIQDFLSQQARENQLWIIGGTIPIMSEDEQRIYAACLVFNDKGERIIRYDKIHLYDAVLENGKQVFQESAKTIAGKTPIVFDSPIGKIGLAVCYDLRFADLFNVLREHEAEILVVPSAFVQHTGAAHWEILCRARAIETQSYVVAANQTGQHNGTRCSFGHSMIVDPWGKIMGEIACEPGILTQTLDLEYLRDIRKKMPMKHCLTGI